MQFYLFYNPKRKALLNTLHKFQKLFPQAQHVHHFNELADLSTGTIVCFGGDGTFHNIINHAAHTHRFILVPCGSGNDFVRNFTPIPGPYVSKAIVHNHFHKVGLLKVNHIFGLNAAGFLYDALVASKVQQTKHKTAIGYAIHAISNIFSYPAQKLVVNDVPQSMLLLSFGNGAYAGGGFKLFPGTHPTNFSFMRLQIGPISYLKRLLYLILVRPGLHAKLQGVHLSACTHTSISAMHNITGEIDGEMYDLGNHITIGYLPSAISIMVAIP